MIPFYSDEYNSLYTTDSQDLSFIKDRTVHLIITSPPYNVGKEYGTYVDNNDAYYEMLEKVFTECHRVLVTGGRIAINAPSCCKMSRASRNAYVAVDIHNMLLKIGFVFPEWLIWDKLIGVSETTRTQWGSFASCSAPYLRDACEVVIIAHKEQIKLEGNKEDIDITKQEFMDWTCNLWKIPPTNQSKSGHPAAFPQELVKRIIKLYSYRNNTVLDPFAGCFDKETEVMTTNGWKRFNSLDGNEDFYSLTPEHNIEILPAIKYHKYNINGAMIRFKGRSVDLLVTPNHSVYVKEYHKKNFELTRADKVIYAQFHKFGTGVWTSSKTVDLDWLRLLGFYIGDGFKNNRSITRGFRTRFKLKKDRKRMYLIELLKKLNIGYKEYKYSDYSCFDTQGEIYHKLFPEGSSRQHDRYIPQYIFTLSSDCIKAVLEGLTESDGCRIGDSMIIYTASPQLADDIQRLSILAGRSSCVSKRTRMGFVCYEVSLHQEYKQYKLTKNNISKEQYTGEVYDVTLPRNHTLMVRRNGKAVWSGNSGTTLVMAKKLGRKGIGVEISRQYCDLIKSKISQLELFSLGGG